MEQMMRKCELCNGEAVVYCPSDNAFLCYTCDCKVHCANFLVARHVRSFICPFCYKLQEYYRFSGTCVPSQPMHVSCENCMVGDCGGEDDDSIFTSSSCVSSTGEPGDEVEISSKTNLLAVNKICNRVTRKDKIMVVADMKVEGVLVNWCRKMNVEDKYIGGVVNMAVDLLTTCLSKITSLPFRVSLAAAYWVAIRVVCHRRRGYSSTCQDLKRVEQISGVPAKLIMAIEVKLTRVMKRKQSSRDIDHKEGWAEC